MNTIATYTYLNNFAQKRGIVLLGSTFAYDFPLNELIQNYSVSKKIYNRSIPGLKIKEAEQYFEDCILALQPAKMIINLGDEDINSDVSIPELIEEYRWLLYKVHTLLPNTVLIITSIDTTSDNAVAFNHQLKKLARELGCEFLTIQNSETFEEHTFAFFKSIKTSLYDATTNFSDLAAKAVLDSMIQY
ncbi:MAG: SGNH/GDSL hydrolase family protein [Lachnospiraceae bacterium]